MDALRMENDVITTRINSDILLSEYKKGIRFGTDALLLSHFCGKGKRGCDLGSGSGVVSLLLLSLGKAQKMTGIELAEEYASLSRLNAENNGFADTFECIGCDVKDIKEHVEAGSMDIVVTNPPYLPSSSGKKNEDRLKYTAFHETTSTIDEFVASAGYILKYGGSFFCVYRPEYISKLICAMEANSISLKRLRYVSPSVGKPPCLVLVEGKKNGRPGAKTEPTLYLYSDASHTRFTDETEEIYRSFG